MKKGQRSNCDEALLLAGLARLELPRPRQALSRGMLDYSDTSVPHFSASTSSLPLLLYKAEHCLTNFGRMNCKYNNHCKSTHNIELIKAKAFTTFEDKVFSDCTPLKICSNIVIVGTESGQLESGERIFMCTSGTRYDKR